MLYGLCFVRVLPVLASAIMCLCVSFVIYGVMVYNSLWGVMCLCLCVRVCVFWLNGCVDVACGLLCDAVRLVHCFCVLFRVWGERFVTSWFVCV